MAHLRLLARPQCDRLFSSGLQAARPRLSLLGGRATAFSALVPARRSLGWLQAHRPLSGTPATKPEEPKLAMGSLGGMRKNWETIKDLFSKYGKIFALYWGAMYVTNLGMVYVVIKVAGVDGLEILRYFGIDQMIDTSWWSPGLINFLVAAEINEWIEIVRLPFVASTTPRLARYLRGEPEPSADGAPEATPPDDTKGAGPKA